MSEAEWKVFRLLDAEIAKGRMTRRVFKLVNRLEAVRMYEARQSEPRSYLSS